MTLELVGTVLEFRRGGLAKVLIFVGLNRVVVEGTENVHVGSIAGFYQAIGFREVFMNNCMGESFLVVVHLFVKFSRRNIWCRG